MKVTFTINNNFYKQTDGCKMGGPLSVIFSDIFMIKMENDTVIPTKAIFYHRQAPKFHTLAITIYHYRNLDLVVATAKIVQNILETTKN